MGDPRVALYNLICSERGLYRTVLIPVSESLVGEVEFDLVEYLRKQAANHLTAWCASHWPDETFEYITGAARGPLDYFYEPGDLPPGAKGYTIRVQIRKARTA
jgi:hypothetical protein